jgi:glucose-1-phosphate cytidylyltransferase
MFLDGDADGSEGVDFMKVMILAGGMGTRLAEETEARPKPILEIGDRPILWHIMKHYAHHEFREFLVALGYKGEVIKRYFLEYHALDGGMTVRLGHGQVDVHREVREDWLVHLLDTGVKTQTGGRLKRLQPWLQDGTFMLTYGDGVANVDLKNLLAFHQSHGGIATLTAVRPPARFGALELNGPMVSEFKEKSQTREGWINGGFMVFEPAVFDYIADDSTVLERDVLEKLAADGRLAAYRHDGFWQCADTLRDLRLLRSLWEDGDVPWKVWEE